MDALQKLNTFDPNTVPGAEWATFCPQRNPEFRLHPQRGTAMNAVTTNAFALLYHWNDQTHRWEQILRKCRHDHKGICSQCGGSTMGQVHWSKQPRDLGKFKWVMENRHKIRQPPELVFLCQTCARFA